GGTLRFAPGAAREQRVTVATFNDNINEPSEGFGIALSNPDGAAAVIDPGHSAAQAVIVPSDPVTYSFAQSGVTVAENGASAAMTLRLSAPVEGGITIAIGNTRAETGAVADHLSLSANQFVFASGETSKSITVSPRADNIINEAAARVRVYLPYRVTVSGDHPPVALAGVNPFVITVTDNDPIRVGFTGTRTGTITEGGASATRRISVLGSPAPSTRCCGVVVSYRITGGVDFTDLIITAGGKQLALTGQVLIPAGSTFVDMTLAARRDADSRTGAFAYHDNSVQPEVAETATITLTGVTAPGAASVNSATATATATIAANDEDTKTVNRVYLFRTNGATSLDLREPRGPLTVESHGVLMVVTRPIGASQPAVTIRWRIIGVGDNPVEPNDFTDLYGNPLTALPSGTVSYATGETYPALPKIFHFVVINDNTREGPETFVIRLDPVAGENFRTNVFQGTILPPASGEGEITYNATVTPAGGGAATNVVTEGSRYRVNLSIVNQATEHAGLRFDYAFAGTGANPATSADLPHSGSLRYDLPAGTLNGSFTFLVPEDGHVEVDEGVRLRVTAAKGRFSANNGASLDLNLTLRDNDSAYLSVPQVVSAVEGDTVTVQVRAAPTVPGAVTVHYTLTPATGAGLVPVRFTDESATPGRVIIPAGVAGAGIAVRLLDSPLPAGRGRVNLNVDRWTVPAAFDGRVSFSNTATQINVALRDFDRRFRVSHPGTPVVEGGVARFTVSVYGEEPAAGNPARVNWRLVFGADGAAAADVSGATSGEL
ncbi:MAG: hypothetical protein OXU22_07680, partial [Gammaproteobacteria bacterium]|nr:hypothetical protein [Gammaproteobacteria bacterium]